MKIPLLGATYADESADFRSLLPRNQIPVPKQQGISQGYYRPADGITQFATGVGGDRGGVNWNGVCYRVSGSQLVRVDEDGTVTPCGDVGAGGQVAWAMSFDRLGIASGGSLYYWNGSTLLRVTDPDIGTVLDVEWMSGYFLTTDGEFIVATELTDPTSVNPLKYGSSEYDPDPIKAVRKIGSELYALNRYSIQAYSITSSTGFPFTPNDGAVVTRGVIGSRAFGKLIDTFIFVGSGREEPPSIYVMTPGGTQRVATREIDTILQQYTEAELAQIVVDIRVDKGHAMALFRLPNQTIAYDVNASKAAGESIWITFDSGLISPSAYRACGFVWAYDRWIVGDPGSTAIGTLTNSTMEHFSQSIGWEFGMSMIYGDGNDAIVTELELVGLPGRVAFGANPVIWTSHSYDGEEWSMEKAVSCGKRGQRMKRIAWRHLGKIRHYRMQKFRGTSEAFMSFAAVEAQFEPLVTRPGNG